MKLILNAIIVLVILGCLYLLYLSIKEPLEFQKERDSRNAAVISRLKTIKDCQEMYRDIYNKYAPTFEELANGLKIGKFRTIKVIGDPDDPDFKGIITYDTIYESAVDSIRNIGYTKFDMVADTIRQGNIILDVLECGIQRKAFMGKYADISYKKFDNRYDPDSRLKFGDLRSPSLTGNWESK